MSRIKKILAQNYIKIIAWFLAGLLFATYASGTIYYYATPKAYAVPQQKGRLEGDPQIYDCIVPKAALVEGDGIWLAYSWQSATGEKHSVAFCGAEILASDDYSYAVSLRNAMKDWLVVVAWEGELLEKGDVIVLRP
ncbi:MAG: hypothetical protein FWH48_07400 [Oscillospiraceae bacterium]|nr:hypothetical protein [Oscillospiraceae bacterium]